MHRPNGVENRSGDPIPTTEPEPQWSMTRAFLLAWLLPATAAQRTQHASLLKSFAAHFVALLLGAATIFLMVAWAETGFAADLDEIAAVLMRVYRELTSEINRFPLQTVGTVLGVAALVEVGHLLLALILMPWGAVDEPMRASFRNALRDVWLCTARLLPAVLLIGAAAMAADTAGQRWRDANPYPQAPTAPPKVTLPPTDPGFAQADAEYKELKASYDLALAEYQRAWRQHRNSQPIYTQTPAFVAIPASFVLGLWLLWGLLRGIGAPRRGPRIERPPMCEACGYNLTATPLDSRCPECGVAVMESLGPDVRLGTMWERANSDGFVAWWDTVATAVSRPTDLGRQIAVTTRPTAHRRFLAWHLPCFACLGFVAIPFFACVAEGIDKVAERPEFLLVVGPTFACLVTAGAILVTCGEASLLGMAFQHRYKRNLMAATIQITSYLSAYLLVWALFAVLWTAAIILMAEAHVFRAIELATGVQRDVAGTLMWIIPNGVWLIGYFSRVGRAVGATKYANR